MTTTSIRARRRARREEGQAYVEFALVLPLLLLIVMGIIQFGTVFKDYIALTDAVRVGARQAAVSRSIQPPAARDGVIEQKIKAAAGTLDTSKLDIEITHDADWTAASDVIVRARYPLKIDILGLVVFDSWMNSRTTERIE